MKHIAFAILTALSVGACLGPVTVAPVTVKPIHMTIDINVHDHRDADPGAASQTTLTTVRSSPM